MDKEEKLSLSYLESLGFENISYEPDGNIPPDFLIDKRIAIEVRRLNQNFLSGDRNSGLENIRFPLFHKIQNLLSEITPDAFEKSYFVSYTFRRPINLNGVISDLKNLLTQLSENGHVEIGAYAIRDRFKIRIFPASKKHRQLFILGGNLDHDSGGFVVSEVNRNLEICTKEKSVKIKDVRWKYPEWWLVLIDYIGYGLSENDLAQLKEIQKTDNDWDKIILVNPLNPKRGIEI